MRLLKKWKKMVHFSDKTIKLWSLYKKVHYENNMDHDDGSRGDRIRRDKIRFAIL